MAQTLRQNTLTDQNGHPIAGANIYVYDNTGAPAVLTSDGTTSLSQPVITDTFGNYQYYANAGGYAEDIFLGTHRIWKQAVAIGTGSSIALTFQIYKFTYTSGPQTFTLPITPTSGVQEVWRNGIVVDEADWSIAGATITIGAAIALFNGDMIRVRVAQAAITIQQTQNVGALGNFANDAAAAAGGVLVGNLYRNGSVVQVRVT